LGLFDIKFTFGAFRESREEGKKEGQVERGGGCYVKGENVLARLGGFFREAKKGEVILTSALGALGGELLGGGLARVTAASWGVSIPYAWKALYLSTPRQEKEPQKENAGRGTHLFRTEGRGNHSAKQNTSTGMQRVQVIDKEAREGGISQDGLDKINRL